MSTLQLVFVVVAVSAATIVLLWAFVASRALKSAGAALQRTSQRLSATAVELPGRAADARTWLAQINGQTDVVLRTLDELDIRMDRATADVLASRAASDTLRLRLIEGRLTIARIRQLVRLLMRLGELRRDFL
jgi:hypothetical protein